MNKTILLTVFAFLFVNLVSINKSTAQEHIIYEFNTNGDAEGWESTGDATLTVADGILNIDEPGKYGGIWTGTGFNLSESVYTKVVIEIENNLTMPTFQLVNLDLSGTKIGNGQKQDFEVPMNSGYYEVTVNIPPAAAENNQIIDRLGIRAKGEVAGSWNIKSIMIFSENSTATTYTLSSAVTGAGAVNPAFGEYLAGKVKEIEPNTELDLSGLQGVYFLKIRNDNSENIQKRIAK